MKEIYTILDKISENAKKEPDKIIMVWLDEEGKEKKHLSCKNLWSQSLFVAYKLRKKWNLQKGDRLLLILPPGIKFYIIFIGCLNAGIIVVPTYPPSPNNLSNEIKKITHIIENSGASIAITSSSLKRVLKFSSQIYWPKKVHIKTISKLYQHKNEFIENKINENDLAFLQYTSGSTSEPKGVMISHKNLLHNIKTITKASGTHQNTIAVSWLPQYHDYGLIGHLHFIYNGVLLYLFSPITFLHQPLIWLKILSDKKATTTGAPFFAFSLVLRKWKKNFNINLSNLEYIQCAAEPINTKIILEFLETFSFYGLKKEIFCPSYGLAEHTVYVIDHPRLKPLKILNNKISCGLLQEDIDIKIVNPETQEECEDGKEGEIWINSPSKALGYWNLADLTEKNFNAKINNNNNNNNYLRTGDLGFIEEDWLYVTGRIKDIIIINGKNYYPQDIEIIVSNCSECIKPGNVAAFSIEKDNNEGIVIVAEVRIQYSKNKKLMEQLAKYIFSISSEQKIPIISVNLIEEKSIPKTTSGKIQRQKTKKQYLENELKIIFSFKPLSNVFQINELNKDFHICIIGAGPSGLSAAKYLQDRGYYNITILEKENYVGGKSNGFIYNNSFINFGMYFVSTILHKITFDLARELNVEIRSLPADEKAISDVETIFFSENKNEKIENFLNFKKFIIENYPNIIKPGFHENIGDLWKKTDDWIKEHPEAEVDGTYFTLVMAAGKAPSELVPMAYYLKLLFFGIYSHFHVAPNGFYNLFNILSKKIQEFNTTKIILNTKILSIERNDKIIINTKEKKYEFDKLIIACPLENTLEFLDTSEVEKQLIEKIIYNEYVVTYCKMINVPFKMFLYKNMSCNRVGHVVFFSGAEPNLETSLFQTSQYGTDFITGKPIDTEELKKILVNDIEELGGKVIEIYHIYRWKYFPHIKSEDFASGWYKSFHLIQGFQNTYYINPIFNFETVERCLEYSKYIIDNFFPVLNNQLSKEIKLCPTSTLEDVTLFLQKIFSKSLETKMLPEPSTPITDFGLQSIQLVEILSHIEQELVKPLPPTIILQSKNINSLAQYIYYEIKGETNEKYYEGTIKISNMDSMFYQTKDIIKSRNLPYFVIIFVQFMTLFLKPYLLSLAIVPAYYFILFMYNNFGIYPAIASLPIAWIIISISSCIIVIVIKWVLIGKFCRKTVIIWGNYYLCWWIINHIYQIAYLSYPLINETIFLNIFYRALGAKIGKNVIIKGELREWDLINISNNVKIEKGSLITGCTVLKGQKLRFDKVIISENCIIGASSYIGPGANIPSFFELPPFSVAPSLWTRAKSIKKNSIKFELMGFIKTIFGILVIGILNTISIIPGIIIIWILISSQKLTNIYLQVIVFSSILFLLFIFIIGPIYCLLIYLTKKFINLFFKKNKVFNCWILYRLTECLLQTWWIAFWSWTPIICLYYKILGLKIGKNCLISRIQTIDFENIIISDNTIIGGEVIIFANKKNKVTIGEGCIIGNNVIMEPGTILEKEITIGSYTLLRGRENYQENTTWLGSPAICLQSLGKKSKKNNKKTNFYQYLTIFFTLILFIIIIIFSLLPSLEFSLLITKYCGLKNTLFIIPILFYFSLILISIIFIAVKWVIIGSFKEGSYEFWSNYFIRWRIISILILIIYNIILRDFLGTPFINLWYSMMGSKIGKRVCILSDSEDNPRIEADTLSIYSHSSLGFRSIILGHVIDNNILQILSTVIRDKVCIGSKSIIQPGVTINPAVIIGEQSLIIKSQNLMENTLWRGNPAFPVNEKLYREELENITLTDEFSNDIV